MNLGKKKGQPGVGPFKKHNYFVVVMTELGASMPQLLELGKNLKHYFVTS